MRVTRIIGIAAVVSLIAQGMIAGAVPAGAQQLGITGAGYAGDFNGDSKQDVANYSTENGVWMVGLSTGTRFNFTPWGDHGAVNGWTHRIGDFNGDARDDIFGYRSNRLVVGVSDGASFTISAWRELTVSRTWQTFIAGDYNGDGIDDIAGYDKGAETWQVFISTGTGFLAGRSWSQAQSVVNWSHVGGDFDGDGKDDTASFNPDNATWRVHVSTGSGFTTTKWETLTPTTGWGRKRPGDFNGDGRTDIANFLDGSEWRVSKSRIDNTFNTAKWAEFSPANDWSEAVVGDYNGDGTDGIANFRTSVAAWYVSQTSGPTSFQTSVWGDLSPDTGWTDHVGGDFTGDGLDDVASFHQGQGTWWVGVSQGTSFTLSNWNPPNMAPEAGFTFDCQGLTCQFSDTSSDPDGRITSWAWDFGDGTTSPDQNPTHTYQSGNIYTVTLRVSDDQGATDSEERSVTVEDSDAAPVPRFGYQCRRLTCEFTDKSSDDGQITIYHWDFGDGEISDAKNPTHKYDRGGNYTVKLAVTDDAGQTRETAKDILVLQPHKRSVGLRLDHYRYSGRSYLRARGKVKVADGFKACKANRVVRIQRRRNARWVKIAKAVTRADGTYRVFPYLKSPPVDRPGKYRAVAIKQKPGSAPGHLCLKAVSRVRTHSH